jgi:homopolymeric O-antigen transport system ATP-binding protein
VTPAVATANLGKAYRRYAHPRDRVLETLLPGRSRHEDIWVLRNVSVTIGQGEAVAVIGQNGAGKSTLLKLMTGVTKPTEGTIERNGRIAAILELGIGFHPEFTGRQNMLIAGQLLGIGMDEMNAAMPAIAEFAELDDYFDQPLRTYSSGMHVRLAFSVATAVRPDILILDEALAVGDAYFQHKCAARIRSFKAQGTTLLFVSHDPAAVRSLCERALLFDHGLCVKDGPPDEVLEYYNAAIAKREADYEIRMVESTAAGRPRTRSGDRKATIESVDLIGSSGESLRALPSKAPARIRVAFVVHAPLEKLTVGFLIRDRLGNDVFGTNTFHLDAPSAPLVQGQRYTCEFALGSLALGQGHYSIAIALHESDSHLVRNHDWWDHALVFQVLRADAPYRIGIADLPVATSGIREVSSEAAWRHS